MDHGGAEIDITDMGAYRTATRGLLHGQLNSKSGDGRVRPQLLRHQLRNAMAPWFAAVISRHLPPKVLFA